MKTEHVTLPALQVAAALFFASSAHAQSAQTYCVDVNDVIVDLTSCNGSEANKYFVVDGEPGGATGGTVTGAVGTKIDSTDTAALQSAGYTPGGFGQTDGSSSSSSSGSGGSRAGFVGGAS